MSSIPITTILLIESSPQYVEATRLASSGDLEAAADMFGSLYKQLVDDLGDLDPRVAPAAYAYGNTLLRIAQSSTDVFGDGAVDKEGGGNGQQQEEDDEDDEEDDDPAPAPKTESDIKAAIKNNMDEMKEILEIAWECLEIARVIYVKLDTETQSEDKVVRDRLAQCLSRIGDLSMEQGHFEESITDLRQALEIRIKDEEAASRKLAEVHAQLAEALRYLYEEKQQDDVGKRARVDAVHHLACAFTALHHRLSNMATTTTTTTTTTVTNGENADPSQHKKRTIAIAFPDTEAAKAMSASDRMQLDQALRAVRVDFGFKAVDDVTSISSNTEVVSEAKELWELLDDLQEQVENLVLEMMDPDALALKKKAAQVITPTMTTTATTTTTTTTTISNNSNPFGGSNVMSSTMPVTMLQVKRPKPVLEQQQQPPPPSTN